MRSVRTVTQPRRYGMPRMFGGAAVMLLLSVWVSTAHARVQDRSPLMLARQLAEEGDWAACIEECRRIKILDSHVADSAQALQQFAEKQMNAPDRGLWQAAAALPVKAMVGFYRFFVAPALGSRCQMQPSCSRYSMQAGKTCGWLGLPMTADRLICEASMVNARHHPVTNEFGAVYFADPVTDHIGCQKKRPEWLPESTRGNRQ